MMTYNSLQRVQEQMPLRYEPGDALEIEIAVLRPFQSDSRSQETF
jgi:hypothetical protein